MKVEVWFVGKTQQRNIQEGVLDYAGRLAHYLPITFVEIPDIRNAGKLSADQLREKEGEVILARIQSSDRVVLLDEKGKMHTSKEFSHWMDKSLQSGSQRLLFVVGGAYGFSSGLYKRSNHLLSLSKMTFSHQMVRLFLAEQLYRAMTILRNEPYHHD